jgi:hypothetical protein
MNDEFERIWKEAAVVAQSKYYPGIFLKVPRKARKNLSV